jgi:hypothetical protein
MYGSENGLCAAGVDDCPYPSSTRTQPGNIIGPTEDGTDYRLDNTDPACDTWDEVVVETAEGQWIRTECNPFLEGGNPDSLQVIVVPIVQTLCNGSCTVTIIEFALFFLEGYGPGGCTGNNCEVTGRFIGSNTNIGALIGVYDPDATTAHFVRLVE